MNDTNIRRLLKRHELEKAIKEHATLSHEPLGICEICDGSDDFDENELGFESSYVPTMLSCNGACNQTGPL